jgi:hypothetical protein
MCNYVSYSVFKNQLRKIRSGNDSRVVTPVPIPNTEVKHSNGEGSMARSCENSKLPVFLLFFFGRVIINNVFICENTLYLLSYCLFMVIMYNTIW